jgi:hypothetical protein
MRAGCEFCNYPRSSRQPDNSEARVRPASCSSYAQHRAGRLADQRVHTPPDIPCACPRPITTRSLSISRFHERAGGCQVKLPIEFPLVSCCKRGSGWRLALLSEPRTQFALCKLVPREFRSRQNSRCSPNCRPLLTPLWGRAEILLPGATTGATTRQVFAPLPFSGFPDPSATAPSGA